MGDHNGNGSGCGTSYYWIYGDGPGDGEGDCRKRYFDGEEAMWEEEAIWDGYRQEILEIGDGAFE